jgi:hypothetical protein
VRPIIDAKLIENAHVLRILILSYAFFTYNGWEFGIFEGYDYIFEQRP